MFYIHLGMVMLACMYAVPLIVTLIQDTRRTLGFTRLNSHKSGV